MEKKATTLLRSSGNQEGRPWCHSFSVLRQADFIQNGVLEDLLSSKCYKIIIPSSPYFEARMEATNPAGKSIKSGSWLEFSYFRPDIWGAHTTFSLATFDIFQSSQRWDDKKSLIRFHCVLVLPLPFAVSHEGEWKAFIEKRSFDLLLFLLL